MCLAHVGVGPERKKKKKASVYTFCAKHSTPHPSTVYRWKKKAQAAAPSGPPLRPRGHPKRISDVEKLVIGGWVLDRDKEHEHTSIEDIIAFIGENFAEKVSKSWVSKAMASLHITSHRASVKKRKYRKVENPTLLHRFLLTLRGLVDGKRERSQVVAVDNVRFSHAPAVLRSYGPEGG